MFKSKYIIVSLIVFTAFSCNVRADDDHVRNDFKKFIRKTGVRNKFDRFSYQCIFATQRPGEKVPYSPHRSQYFVSGNNLRTLTVSPTPKEFEALAKLDTSVFETVEKQPRLHFIRNERYEALLDVEGSEKAKIRSIKKSGYSCRLHVEFTPLVLPLRQVEFSSLHDLTDVTFNKFGPAELNGKKVHRLDLSTDVVISKEKFPCEFIAYFDSESGICIRCETRPEGNDFFHISDVTLDADSDDLLVVESNTFRKSSESDPELFSSSKMLVSKMVFEAPELDQFYLPFYGYDEPAEFAAPPPIKSWMIFSVSGVALIVVSGLLIRKKH